MHVHWHVVVFDAGPNAYLQCRCGARRIRHVDRGRPMNYRWLATGEPLDQPMPTRGPSGGAGQARAR